jgi:hypothetical protein
MTNRCCTNRGARGEAGYTLVELLFAAGLATTVVGVAVAGVRDLIDDYRTLGAVRYIASRLQHARVEAVNRSADAALRFTAVGGSYRYALYLDGNRNGVLGADIARGIDREIRETERLSEQFPRVDFGAVPGLPAVEQGGVPPGNDPVRCGSSDMLTFTPLGTATPGSLYIRGPRDVQYVVRVFGTTGRTRILRFDSRRRQWKSL